MTLIDTHCHLAHGRLRPQATAAIERARQAGVAAVICAAGDLRESRAAAELADAHGDVFSLAGVHPHDARSAARGYLEELERLLGRPKTVALGEIGLDYHYDYSPRPTQRQVFAEQLELARRLAVPVVIHTREAFADTLAVLDASGVAGDRVVLHSFTGTAEEARAALDRGAMISFSGIATFRTAEEVRRACRIVPDDRILVETDAPFLSPEPVRRMSTNEPANVVHVAAHLSAVRGADPETFAQHTTANAKAFFHLDELGIRP